MKMIKRRLCLSGCAAGASLLLLICFLVLQEYLPAGIAAGVAGIGIVLLVREIQKLNSAKLIMENRIIDICPATVSSAGDGGKPVRQVIECVFSPFGLLVEGKVYKFGRDGIHLHSIDIGESRITAEFGDEAKRWTAVMLYGPLSEEELTRLVEKVRYETGITPTVRERKHPHQRKDLK